MGYITLLKGEGMEKLLIVIVFVLTISSMFMGCTDDNTAEEDDLITAKEGIIYADEVAKRWNEDFKLISIFSSGGTVNGYCYRWGYTYRVVNSSKSFDILDVWVDKNLKNQTDEQLNYSYINDLTKRLPIELNECIDSNLAYSIAKSRPTFNDWLDKPKHTSIDMRLKESRNLSTYTWIIEVDTWESLVHRHGHLGIDAMTGEVRWDSVNSKGLKVE